MHPLQREVSTAFEAEFGAPPTWTIRAPGRVNLIGEHTDYNDGFVLPLAIDRAAWLGVRPRADGQIRMVSLSEAEPAQFALEPLAHGSPRWSEYVRGVAWALGQAGYALHGWEGVLVSDVPIGAGLSSSAALEMAVARAFAQVGGWAWEADKMALVGQTAENDWVGANTGIMDQMISAAGRAGHALLIDCRDLTTTQVPLSGDTAVVIMDTMTRHTHTDSGYNERREQCETAVRFFGVSHLRDVSLTEFRARADELNELVRRRARHVITENERVLQAAKALRAGDNTHMGRLMNESHASMRDDFEITNAELNLMVTLAQSQPHCYGARMTGGGFGGCAVALVAKTAAPHFAEQVAIAYQQETKLEPQVYICIPTDGARVVATL